MSQHQRLQEVSLYQFILIFMSILQSSTELVHIGCIYIYVYSGFVYFSLCCVLYKRSSSHRSGPWEGAFNQLGNKLTIDDL